MSRRLISSGSTFEKSIGYSRAVVDGDWIFVSGTTGFDYGTMTIQDDAVAQCEQALRNIETALSQANSGFADVVRVHYLMTNAADFERCWPAMGKAFGEVRPAATMSDGAVEQQQARGLRAHGDLGITGILVEERLAAPLRVPALAEIPQRGELA